VRLIALARAASGADEILHSSAEYTATMAADIPGWETEFLGNKAKQHGVFILAQLKEKLPEYPDRFFNTVFLIDPAGKIVYKHRKNVVLFVEHSTTPHDVYDQWVKTHGDTLMLSSRSRKPTSAISAAVLASRARSRKATGASR
jgi:predicted amidohydrolase